MQMCGRGIGQGSVAREHKAMRYYLVQVARLHPLQISQALSRPPSSVTVTRPVPMS